MLKKYGAKARNVNKTLIPDDLTAHKVRHTTAMELITSGFDLMYIRDLGTVNKLLLTIRHNSIVPLA